MHLRLSVKSALAALGIVNGITAGSRTIPILNCTRIDARPNATSFTVSDLDREARVMAEARVETPGAICVPTRMLADIARNLPKDGEIAFHVKDGAARLVCGRSRFTLPTLPVEDFPVMAAADEGEPFELDAAEFARILEAVSPAISTEETRYYLNGIYLHVVDDRLSFVATDGHKLMRWRTRAPIPNAFAPVIAPSATVKEMRRLAADLGKDARIRLATTPTRLTFEAGDARLVSKVVDGTFPDYARIMPGAPQTRVTVETERLLAALARAETVAGESRRVALDFGDGRVVVSAADSGGGSAEDEADVEIDGPSQRVALNLKYLTAMARAFGGAKLTFAILDAGAPIALSDPAHDAGIGVIMPMR